MSKTMVVAIIPARYASQRLPAKPLADICGKPMIQHVYERTSKALTIDKTFVATDDERIASAVRAFGGNCVMTPATLQTGTDRIAHAAKSLPDADIVVNVQGDEPLIEPSMIDEAVKPLLHDDSISAGTLVRRIDNVDELVNPGIVKVAIDGNGNALYFSRSSIPFGRDIEQRTWLEHHSYYKHIGLYVFRSEFLDTFTAMGQTPLEKAEKLEQLRILENGYNIRCTVTSFDSIPVDTENDLARVRRIMEKNQMPLPQQ
jgi:3-deoxy-manno-octulosonate cytidylyltransferase (CMP-KDO synthetase)